MIAGKRGVSMTESEAIKWLRDMQNPMISEAELYCTETYYGLGKMVFPEPEDYVFETAIKALEKQEKIKEAVANANKWSNILVKAQAFCEIEKILRSDEK